MTDDLRIDPLTGTSVIVVPARENRPNLPTSGCPFCVGGREAPDPYEVRAFPNRWPSLTQGRAEVVLFSPEHDESLGHLPIPHLRKVIDLWAERYSALGSRDDVSYVLIFENRGAEVGATIAHPHGQIYAYPQIPPIPLTELNRAADSGHCAICAEQPVDRLVGETPRWRAWIPYASGHPYNVVVAPTEHLGSLTLMDDATRDGLAGILRYVLHGLDTLFEEQTPYMWWIHQAPTDGNEWPLAHAHIEIVALRRSPGVTRYVAGAELGSGTLINSVDPRTAAQALRLACQTGEPTCLNLAPFAPSLPGE